MQYTFPSIQRHVYDVLTRNNIVFDVYVSTVGNAEYYGHPMDTFEVSIVRPCIFSIVPQEILLENTFASYCKRREYNCKRQGRMYDDSMTVQEMKMYNAKKNRFVPELKRYFLCFDSQKRLAEMIRIHTRVHSFVYDAVLFLRPDVAFIRDIDLPAHFPLLKGNSHKIWIPDFQHFNGVNDRAAFGSQEVMLKYLERGDAYMSNRSYGVEIAEGFLAKYLQTEGIVWQKSSMRFLRVRPMEDFNSADVGVIVGFDYNPKHLNVAAGDKDLLRCAGSVEYMHREMKFPYKAINATAC